MTNKSQTPSWFSECKELVVILGLFLVSASVVVGVVTWKLSFEEAAQTLAPAGLAMLGAVISTVVLYSRWRKDFAQREMIEHNRIQNENRRLELQELSKRREALGSRLAMAVDHLSSTNGFTQVAGLIELGGLADDWWNLGIAYGAIPDKEGQSTDTKGARARKDLTFKEVQQRRQEIVTLIFCHKLPGATESDSIGDEDRQDMVQRARADLLRRHTDNTESSSESSQPSPESWHRFNLDGAWLKGAQLKGVYLGGTSLVGANLQGANLEYACLQRAKLQHSKLQHAYLRYAKLQGATLIHSNLQHTWLVSANLERAVLASANLQDAILQGAKLQHTWLVSANLERAVLASANLQGANLDIARLQKAQLLFAELRGADFRGATYSKSTQFPPDFKPDDHGLILDTSE